MRATLSVILTLTTLAAAGVAYALDASDPMSSWKEASAEAKAALVKELLKGSGRAYLPIVKCVDQAASVSGHANLRVGEMVKACMADDDTQPV